MTMVQKNPRKKTQALMAPKNAATKKMFVLPTLNPHLQEELTRNSVEANRRQAFSSKSPNNAEIRSGVIFFVRVLRLPTECQSGVFFSVYRPNKLVGHQTIHIKIRGDDRLFHTVCEAEVSKKQAYELSKNEEYEKTMSAQIERTTAASSKIVTRTALRNSIWSSSRPATPPRSLGSLERTKRASPSCKFIFHFTTSHPNVW